VIAARDGDAGSLNTTLVTLGGISHTPDLLAAVLAAWGGTAHRAKAVLAWRGVPRKRRRMTWNETVAP
jgi:hypothetical protein